jgi:hypothetical protein
VDVTAKKRKAARFDQSSLLTISAWNVTVAVGVRLLKGQQLCAGGRLGMIVASTV